MFRLGLLGALTVIYWSYLYLYMMRSKVIVYLPQSKLKSWRSNVSQILRYACWVRHIMHVCYSSYALVILTADLHGVMQRNESICTDFQLTAVITYVCVCISFYFIVMKHVKYWSLSVGAYLSTTKSVGAYLKWRHYHAAWDWPVDMVVYAFA